MKIRRFFERLSWRLAGFRRPSRVYPTSRIKIAANPVELRFQSGDRLLILAPHPDDEVLGCGGLLAQALADQVTVWVVYLTDGRLGGDPERRRAEAEAVREYYHQRCGRTFTPFFGHHKELALNQEAIRAEVKSYCQELAPHYLFLPHQGDNHRDHRDLNLAVSGMVAELRQQSALQILGYEIWAPLRMDVFVDITRWEEDKRRLIGLYASQRRPKDYAAMILALNRYRAACLPGPVRLAEALEVIDASG